MRNCYVVEDMCSVCAGLSPHETAVRMSRWADAWCLPRKEEAFGVLGMRRPGQHQRFNSDIWKAAGFSEGQLRSMRRVWQHLAVFDSSLACRPDAQVAALLGARAFPTSPLLAFECALHALHNILPVTNSDHGLAAADAFLREARGNVWRHLAVNLRLEPAQYFFPVMRELLHRQLGNDDWIRFFDAVFTHGDGDQLLIRAAIAMVVMHERDLLTCESCSDVARVLSRRVDCSKLLRQASVLTNVVVDLPPVKHLATAHAEYYPPLVYSVVHSVGTDAPPPAAVLQAIALDELDLRRAMENRIDTLNCRLDVLKLHRILSGTGAVCTSEPCVRPEHSQQGPEQSIRRAESLCSPESRVSSVPATPRAVLREVSQQPRSPPGLCSTGRVALSPALSTPRHHADAHSTTASYLDRSASRTASSGTRVGWRAASAATPNVPTQGTSSSVQHTR